MTGFARLAGAAWIGATAIVTAAGCAGAPIRADTVAAERFAEWLQAFNSGDDTELRCHLKESFVPDPKGLLKQNIACEMADRFKLVKIDESSATRFIAQLRAEPSGAPFAVALEVEPRVPHRVSRFSIARLSSQMPEAEALRRGRTFVERLAAQDEFSGVVLVGRNGTPIFHEAYGYADRTNGIRNQLGTQFSTASIGKVFTAVAILQLVQAGKVRLDAPLGTYLADYPNAEVAAQTTIHQLLTHTAGTGDIDWPVSPEDHARQLRLRAVSDYLHVYGPRKPLFRPGTRWSYSNYGYILLGAVIERVTGQSYYDYVIENVFKRADMTGSGFPTVDQPAGGRAVAYMKTADGKWQSSSERSFFRAIPAGGASTTALDLMRFADALLAHKLLDATHTSLLTTGKVEIDRGGVYAYGVQDRRADGDAWFGHGGGAPGMSTDLRIYPWTGYVVIALANVDPPIADEVVQEFADWLPR